MRKLEPKSGKNPCIRKTFAIMQVRS